MKCLNLIFGLSIVFLLSGCLEGGVKTIGSATGSSNTPLTYEWISGAWGGCSATACGTSGTQLRIVICRDSNGNDVADSNCSGTKPATSRSCSPGACGTLSCTLDGVTVLHGQAANFYTTNSVACGSTCPLPLSRSCSNGVLSGSATYNRASCTVGACAATYAWDYSAWSACSTTACGTTGTQTRNVFCKRNDGVTVADSLCTGTKPGASQGCTNPACGGTFAWVTGLNTTPATNMSMPSVNVPYTDPAYGLKVTRVTNASQITDNNIPTWVRHEYSRRPSFNADGTRALMMSSSGWFRLYNVDKVGNKLNFAKTLTIGGSVEPNWHTSNPNLLFFLGNNGQSLKISQYDVTTDTKTEVKDLTSKIKALYPTATGMWTKDEGRPSDNGNIWCFQVESSSFASLGLISYNFATDQILGHLDTAGDRPDHISTGPSGNHCVPSWDSSKGTRAYNLTFTSFTQLHLKSEHSDLATTKDGKDVYVFSDYNSGDMAMVDMVTGVRTNLFRLYGANSSATSTHVSGVGTKHKPGYVVIGFYACSEDYGKAACTDSQWFKDKVTIVELKANPTIYNVAHSQYGNAGYFGETQAVANFDLSKILFVSSWRTTSEANLSSYMVDVPVSTLP